MFQNIGVPGLIIMLVIALIIFGPSKLPEIGRAVGRTLSEFKNSAREFVEDEPTNSQTNGSSYQEDKQKKKINEKNPADIETGKEFLTYSREEEEQTKAN